MHIKKIALLLIIIGYTNIYTMEGAGGTIIAGVTRGATKWFNKNAQYAYADCLESLKQQESTLITTVYKANQNEQISAQSIKQLYKKEYNFYRSNPASYSKNSAQREMGSLMCDVHADYVNSV